MKKLLIFSIILSSLTGFSQNRLLDTNAQWKYYVTYMEPAIWVTSFDRFENIQNKNCYVYKTIEHRFYSWPFLRYGGNVELQEDILFESNDTVYHHHNNQFNTLIVWDAAIGDSWDLGYDTNAFGDSCSKSIVIVSDTGHEEINGVLFKYLDLKMDGPYFSYGFGGRVYEQIGNPRFIAPLISDACAEIIAELPYSGLHCFGNSNFPEFALNGASFVEIWKDGLCEINVSVGVESVLDQLKLKTFPNPFNEKLFIEWPGNRAQFISVLNASAQVFYTGTLQENDHLQINTTSWPSGMYLIKTTDQSGNVSTQKLIRE